MLSKISKFYRGSNYNIFVIKLNFNMSRTGGKTHYHTGCLIISCKERQNTHNITPNFQQKISCRDTSLPFDSAVFIIFRLDIFSRKYPIALGRKNDNSAFLGIKDYQNYDANFWRKIWTVSFLKWWPLDFIKATLKTH